jgi:hypothetical protein
MGRTGYRTGRSARLDFAMMRTPDGYNRLEFSRFIAPRAVANHRNAPVNALGYLRAMFAMDDIHENLEGSASGPRSS